MAAGIASQAYNTAANIGTSLSYLKLGAGIFIGLICLIVGIVFLVKDSKQNSGGISDKTLGWIFVGVGIFIMFGSGVWFYFVQHYKPIAAISGADNLVGLAKTIL